MFDHLNSTVNGKQTLLLHWIIILHVAYAAVLQEYRYGRR